MGDPDATVEQRLTTIEVKLMDLEFAIARMQGTDNDAFQRTADNTPEKGKTFAECRPSESDGPNLAVVGSSSVSETSSQSSASFGGDARPISTATLRPNMVISHPPPWHTTWAASMNLHGISIEQYSALVTLVRREQTARKALEDQVAQLQEALQDLGHASGLPASPPGTLYPIPSPESDDTRRSRRQRTGSSRKGERITIGSEAGTDGNRTQSRQWDSSYHRPNTEVTSRNAGTGRI
jgi:hypothetical protein